MHCQSLQLSKLVYKHVKHQGKLTFLGVKVDKPKSTKAKKANFFFGLKASLHRNKIKYYSFFLKTLKYACLGYVHIPELAPKLFKSLRNN